MKGIFTKLLLVLAIIIIAVMGDFMYELNLEKNENLEKITELTAELTAELNKNEEKEKELEEIKQLVLEGDYSIEASDFGYTFSKDGKVTESGNVHEARGTYQTVAENIIEIVFTEETVWDLDENTKTDSEINRKTKMIYLNEKEMIVIGEDKEKTYVVEKFGE